MLSLLTKFLLLSCVNHYALAALDGHCPPLGPVLPAPTQPSKHGAVSEAATTIKDIINKTTSVYNSSAVAIGVKSIHESGFVFSYTYTPPDKDENGTQAVDLDTVFRIGSVSKLFAPLALLKLGVSLDEPITKYVPELRALKSQAREDSPVWTVEWDDVTLGSLASHMSGIPSDLITDMAPLGNLSAYGYPAANSSELLSCSGFFGTPSCNRTAFFANFGKRPPAQVPFSAQTVYSNVAFAILSFAVETIAKQPFADYVSKEIWKRTNMARTFATQPNASLAFIPVDDIWWPADLGFEGPGGGYFSTINDLHRLGDAILQHKLLSPVRTRKWMKPVTSTSSTGILIGQPWEILQAENVTSDGRMIELYTKRGEIVSYYSTFALIPDYDLVITILVAGPGTPGEVTGASMDLMMSQVVKTLLPAVEKAGKAEAKAAYAGTYVDERTNSTITLFLDDKDDGDNDGPGFSISRYVIRGVDVPITDPGSTILPASVPPVLDPPMRYRLYPASTTTMTRTSDRGMEQGLQQRQLASWRAVGTRSRGADEVAARDAQFAWPMNSCVTWATMDRVTFGFGARDHFVFDLEDGGRAMAVEAVGYKVRMERVSPS
ncbi:beta-lactamase/transpeptidase-like protein [Corynascus similis CBS 632.67]